MNESWPVWLAVVWMALCVYASAVAWRKRDWLRAAFWLLFLFLPMVAHFAQGMAWGYVYVGVLALVLSAMLVRRFVQRRASMRRSETGNGAT